MDNKNKLKDRNVYKLKTDKSHYTYILECQDGTLYTGYTTDIERRMNEHREGINSKYTRARKFKRIRAAFMLNSKSDAMKLEYRIKRLTRKKKLEIIENNDNIRYISEDLEVKNVNI